MPPNDDTPAGRAAHPEPATPLRAGGVAVGAPSVRAPMATGGGGEQGDGAAPAGPDPKDALDHIREIGQIARGGWFALLALLAYVGVTVMAHTDAAFFAAAVATELPVVGLEVPTVAFFIAAPLLMAAFYVHLHLYLIHLWDALADAPARIGQDCLLDRVHPTMIAQAAILYRSRARRDASAPPHAHARAMEAVTLALVWLSTPALLAWLWLRSMPLHDPWLTLWIGACLAAVCHFGAGGARIARGRLSRPKDERETVHAPGIFYRLLTGGGFIAVVAVLFGLSWETTRGGLFLDNKEDLPAFLVSALSRATGYRLPDDHLPPLLVPADLLEAELTPHPSDWVLFEYWLRDFRRSHNIANPNQNPLIPTGDEVQRYRLMIETLDGSDLGGADLRHAFLFAAFLPGVDLRDARMEMATLGWAQMQGADLRGAQMQGAALDSAKMQGADFRDTQMQGTDLRGAQMQGATFHRVQMQGADLGGARMQGADLGRAEMQGANLRRAQMQGSDCREAVFRAALVFSADITCRDATLTQEQLRLTVGNADTILPDGLYVWSCLGRAALSPEILSEIEAALAYHPEEGNSSRLSRAQFEDALFCDEGETPRKVGRHPVPAAAD